MFTRFRTTHRSLALAGLLLALLVTTTWGQEPAAETPVPAANAAARPAIKLGPDTFLVPDADGNLQPVLNLTYEQLLAALAGNTATPPETVAATPRYAVDDLQVTGSIERQYVTATATYKLRIDTDQRVAIPLGLAGAPLAKQPQLSAPVEAIRYDAALGGYVADCQGSAGQSAVVQLDLLIPTRETDDGVALRTNVPRALTSHLVLVANQNLEAVEASEGVILDTESLAAGATRIAVRGLAGEFTLNWRRRTADSQRLESVLSVAGGLRATIDGRSVRTEASLVVQSYGGPFRQFKVRLPRKAKLESHSQGGLIEGFRRDIDDDEVDDSFAGEVWRVDLTEDTEGPVELKLVTDQPLSLATDESATAIELAGFEVLGAVRQYGDVAILVDDNWQLRWDQLNGAEQVPVDQLGIDLAEGEVTAALEYFRQPWAAKVRLLRRDLRIAAAPRYQLELSPEQARLRVDVNYNISGKAVIPMLFDLHDWQVAADPIISRGLASTQWAEVRSDGTFGVAHAEASQQQVEVSFWLTRNLSLGRAGQLVQLPLPTLVGFDGLSVATSELAVSADASLDVVPEPQTMLGLAPQPRELSAATTPEQLVAERFAYRVFQPPVDAGTDPLAVFAATIVPRPRSVQSTQLGLVEVTSDAVQVTQDFLFDVRFQPIDSLRFELPIGFPPAAEISFELLPAQPGNAEVELGLPLVATRLPAPITDDAAAATTIEAALGHSQVGEFRVRVRYKLPAEAATTTDRWRIPLVTGKDAATTSQQLDLRLPPASEWQIAADETAAQWTVNATGLERETGRWQLEAAQPASELVLTTAVASEPTPGRTIVVRRWVQTWLGNTVQQQRVVFAVRSDDAQLRVELPEGVVATEVEAVLDGSVVANQSAVASRLEVALPLSSALTEHVVELRYRQPAARTRWGSVSVALPRVLGDDSFVESYWQLITPANVVVVDHAQWLNSANTWQVTGWKLLPQAALSTTELEQWSGGRSLAGPTAGEQALVYSSLGEDATVSATLVGREWVVLLTAGTILAAALVAIYVPIVRQPRFVLPAAVVLGVLGLAYPRAALICGNAFLVGSALGLLAWLLAVAVQRRAAQATPSTVRSSGSSLAVRPTSDSYPPLVLGSGVSTSAPTVSLHAGE